MAKLVLDPGHSGNPDPGAMGPSGLREADVAMDVCNKLALLLRADGHEVILTRQGDDPQSDDLGYRTNMANDAGADLFLSVHCNSASPQAHGTETYYYTNGSDNSARLAELCQTELVNELGLTDRGVKTAGYWVLKYTSMPAALTELAFICNPNEELLLGDDAFRARCATALYKALYKYLNS